MKYIDNGSRSIADCQNQTWVVSTPSIPHLPTVERRAKPARQNVSHTLVHQHQTAPAACFTVRCVRGEDLVDCVMIGAGRLHLAIIAQRPLYCIATTALCYTTAFCSTLHCDKTLQYLWAGLLWLQSCTVCYGTVGMIWYAMAWYSMEWYGRYDCPPVGWAITREPTPTSKNDDRDVDTKVMMISYFISLLVHLS